jgi:hypothetical protein
VRVNCIAPKGQEKVAGGKRSAAPGSNGLKRSPDRGERFAIFRAYSFLSPLPGLESSLTNRGPRASRLPPATFFCPFGAGDLPCTSDYTHI